MTLIFRSSFAIVAGLGLVNGFVTTSETVGNEETLTQTESHNVVRRGKGFHIYVQSIFINWKDSIQLIIVYEL